MLVSVIGRLRGEQSRVVEDNARLQREIEALQGRVSDAEGAAGGARGAPRRTRPDPHPRLRDAAAARRAEPLGARCTRCEVQGAVGAPGADGAPGARCACSARCQRAPVRAVHLQAHRTVAPVAPRRTRCAPVRHDRARVVHIEVHGQRYPIRTTLDPAYVQELATYVDRKMAAGGRGLALERHAGAGGAHGAQHRRRAFPRARCAAVDETREHHRARGGARADRGPSAPACRAPRLRRRRFCERNSALRAFSPVFRFTVKLRLDPVPARPLRSVSSCFARDGFQEACLSQR